MNSWSLVYSLADLTICVDLILFKLILKLVIFFGWTFNDSKQNKHKNKTMKVCLFVFVFLCLEVKI